jgi:amidase
LKKDALKGVRLGVIRDLKGTDPEVDRVFNESLEELKKQGAVLVDDLHWPAVAQQVRGVVMDPMRAEVKDNYKDYLATLRPGFPRTITELALKGMELTAPQGEFRPHPSVFTRFKALGEREPLTALSYSSAKNFGMPFVQGQVRGLMESNRVEALVYPTRPKQPDLIDPNIANIVERVNAPSFTSIANVTQFPDVIVPAGVTKESMPVTISFFGPAYSEARLLAFAYAYEQATQHRVAPQSTPGLPGERFEY